MGDVANTRLFFLSSALSRQHICLYFLQRVINFSVSVQIIVLCNFHFGLRPWGLGRGKGKQGCLDWIGSGGCEFCSLLGSVGSEWRGDHVSSCKSLDVMSKQQASGSQRTPADCPCDKTRAEDQDGQPPEFTSRALLGSVKRCLQTGILCSNLCQIISLKIRKKIFQHYFTAWLILQENWLIWLGGYAECYLSTS